MASTCMKGLEPSYCRALQYRMTLKGGQSWQSTLLQHRVLKCMGSQTALQRVTSHMDAPVNAGLCSAAWRAAL